MRVLVLLLVLPMAAWAESRCEPPRDALDEAEATEWSGWAVGEDADTSQPGESIGDSAETEIDFDASMAEFLDLGVEEIREWRERSEELGTSLQASSEQVDRGIREARMRHAERLARRGNVEALVGAALVSADLQPGANTSRSLGWLERAATLAPNDARPLWAGQALCAWATDTCDRRHWLKRLVELEPDNGAAWLQLVAVTPPEEPAHEQAVENALSASSYVPVDSILRPILFDSYAGLELDTRLSTDFLRLLQQNLGSAVFPDSGLESLPVLIGALQGMMFLSQGYPDAIGQSCGETEMEPIRSSRADACGRLYQRMFESSTTLADRTMVLVETTRFLDPAEWEAIERRHQWQQTESSRLLMASPERTLDPRYWQTYREEGEIAAIQELLSSTGTSLDPPAGWDMEQAQRDMMREMIIGSDADGR